MRDIGLADLDGLSPVLSAVLLLWDSEQLLKPSYSMDLPVPRGTSMLLQANLIIIFFYPSFLYGPFCSKYANVCFNCSPQGKCVIEKPNVYSLAVGMIMSKLVWRGMFHWNMSE